MGTGPRVCKTHVLVSSRNVVSTDKGARRTQDLGPRAARMKPHRGRPRHRAQSCIRTVSITDQSQQI
eukprot:4743228-Lingulodinium_polyedra.AAC.1